MDCPHFLPFSFWRMAPITALLCGAGRKLSASVHGCKLQPQKGEALGQGEKKAAVGSAPSVPESHRWCVKGKWSRPDLDNIKLIWSCPLLLP